MEVVNRGTVSPYTSSPVFLQKEKNKQTKKHCLFIHSGHGQSRSRAYNKNILGMSNTERQSAVRCLVMLGPAVSVLLLVNELMAGHQVPQLICAPQLDPAAVHLMEVIEVKSLEELVGELAETHALGTL